jgi:hypothetical protein
VARFTLSPRCARATCSTSRLGHDSWVVGDEPYVSLHFMGAGSTRRGRGEGRSGARDDRDAARAGPGHSDVHPGCALHRSSLSCPQGVILPVHAPAPAVHWQPRCDAQDDESSCLHGVIVPPHEPPAPTTQLHCGWSPQVAEPRSSHGVTVPLQVPVHVQPCVWQLDSVARDPQGVSVPTQVMSCVQRQPVCESHVVTSVRAVHGTGLPVQVPPAPPSSAAHVQPVATHSVCRSSVTLVYVEHG